jgi:hypothetical protein
MRRTKKTRHGKCLAAGQLTGDHVPDYLLYGAYGLLAVAVIACLAFIAKSFEGDDADLERVDREK